MNTSLKRVIGVVLLSLLIVASLGAQSIRERASLPYAGKTVILHTNDVHGAIDGYAYIPVLRAQFESQGANVIVVDAGDFTNGDTSVSYSKGLDAVYLMNAAGYDIVTLGNHEFDFGYDQLMSNLADKDFNVLCANVLDNGLPVGGVPMLYVDLYGTSVMFIGLETPETQTKVNPTYVKDLDFYEGVDLYALTQQLIDFGKERGLADIVVVVSHLGVDSESVPNTSYDLYNNVRGIDFIIDGHSHTVMEYGPNGEPIQSTGSHFENVGVVVIDNTKGVIEDHYLISTEGLEKDPVLVEMANSIHDKVNDAYGAVFAKSYVELNGEKSPGNRDMETNLGDLITDAMKWFVLKEGNLKVEEDNVVALTNGGGIRAWIHTGDVTMNDIKSVLPFGNTVTVVYVTGEQLLEALEASTFSLPIGGFPQVSGIDYTVDTGVIYDANPYTYPNSTYYGPASVNRVTVNSINGKDFHLNETYAVVTNDFCAVGGDTYYVFATAAEKFDTNITMDEALMNYVSEYLRGIIDFSYLDPQGRITVY